MYTTIIDLKPYRKRVKEDFGLLGSIFGGVVSGGDKTDIKNKTDITKNFENNQRINRSMAVESVTKLVNNVATDVIQKNTASAASAAGASNVIWLQNVNCDDVVVTGISQNAQAISQVQVKMQQQNMSKIATEISTSIDKTIEKVGATDLDALQADNTKMLNDFMKATPGYEPNKAQEMASQCPKAGDSMISIGNTCNVSNEYSLNASVKQALDLDESFKIKDEDNVSNDIKSKVEQSNFASCQSSANANNAIILSDITCANANAISKANSLDKAKTEGKTLTPKQRGRLEISDIEQKAVAQLYMTCIFDQKNVSEIANKIVNKISKKYSQVYDAVKKKAEKNGPEYAKNAFDFLDVWSAAGMEKIAAAAGNLPKKQESAATPAPTPATTKEKTSEATDSKNTEEKKDSTSSGNDFSDKLQAMPTVTLAPDVSRLTQKPRPVETVPPVTAAPATTAPATTPAKVATTAPVAASASAAPAESTNAKIMNFLDQNKIYVAVGVVATVAIIYVAATYNSD
jgi:hypothetical protein